MASRAVGIDPDEQRDTFYSPVSFEQEPEPHSSETSNASARAEAEQALTARRKRKRVKTKSKSDSTNSSSRRLFGLQERAGHRLEERQPPQIVGARQTQQASFLSETRLSRSVGEFQRIARQNNETSTDEITNKHDEEDPLIPKRKSRPQPQPQAQQLVQPQPQPQPQPLQPLQPQQLVQPQPPEPPQLQPPVVPQQPANQAPAMRTITRTLYMTPGCCIKYPRICCCCYGLAVVLVLSITIAFTITGAIWGARTQSAQKGNDTVTVSAQEVSILQPIDYGYFYKQICFQPYEGNETIFFGKTDRESISYRHVKFPDATGPHCPINATEDTKYTQLFYYWPNNTEIALELTLTTSSKVNFYFLEDLGSRNNLDNACNSLAKNQSNPSGVRVIAQDLPVEEPGRREGNLRINCPNPLFCEISYDAFTGRNTHYSLCFIYDMNQTIHYDVIVESSKSIDINAISGLRNFTDCKSSGDCCVSYKGSIFEELTNPTYVIIYTNESDPNFEKSYNIEISPQRTVRSDFYLIAVVIVLAALICLLSTLWCVLVRQKLNNPDLERCHGRYLDLRCCVRIVLHCRQYPLEEYQPFRRL